jgi:methylated-DNA-[protein]-cysteine S-methyltransferase
MTTTAHDPTWPADALPVNPSTLERLHERLVADATTDGTLDLAYRTLDTAFGALLLVSSPQGLVRVAFDREGHDQVLEALARRVSPRMLRAPGRLDEAARQLADYLAGRRQTFDLPLDLRLAAGFRRQVLDHLSQIAYGRTESYTQVAAATGRPAAVRAVGTACATNPLPLVIPCHRVLRSDGSYGGYLGGTETKQALLALEASAAG